MLSVFVELSATTNVNDTDVPSARQQLAADAADAADEKTKQRFTMKELLDRCLRSPSRTPTRHELLCGVFGAAHPDRDVFVKLLLLQASAGGGKSLGGRWAQKLYALLSKAEQEQARMVLFVSLPEFKEEVLKGHDLLGAFFRRFSFGHHSVEAVLPYLQQQGRFLFILDGLDELVDHVATSLYDQHSLHKWEQSLFIVTARTGFLANREREVAPQDQPKHMLNM